MKAMFLGEKKDLENLKNRISEVIPKLADNVSYLIEVEENGRINFLQSDGKEFKEKEGKRAPYKVRALAS